VVGNMTETVRISFEGTLGADAPPFVVVYDLRVLTGALLSQIMRFGLITSSDKKSVSGKLKGSRRAFTEMIQSYGVGIKVVPVQHSGSFLPE
jgi:hypothetical protein